MFSSKLTLPLYPVCKGPQLTDRTRRKIIRNNEKLAHASAADPSATPEPPRDQSFTRPKVLILLPLRSLALHYLVSHLFPLAPAGTQIENMRPFMSSFSIPSDVEDPLASSSAIGDYPLDHLVNFRGNSDDNFRIGIKITRKAWRVVMMPANEAKLMECDILIASPLGIKMQGEKEDSTDLLSSIEVAVVDGLDVMQMQNWDHVQVSSHYRLLPSPIADSSSSFPT
jgi:U3 small nucleolar RNA-associated protein 25